MRITFDLRSGVNIHFNMDELKAAHAVLKGMANFFKVDFIEKAAKDVENVMKVPRLPFSQYHHICEKCFTEIDIRQNAHDFKDGKWTHRTCPTLNPHRPV